MTAAMLEVFAQQRTRPRAHLRLAKTVVDIAADVRTTRELTWQWVRGLGANAGNRWVDRLARMGLEGTHLNAVDAGGLPVV